MSTKKTWTNKLNRNQIKFCELYVSQEFFCSWVKSYMKAYNNKNYNVAKTEASKFLTNPNILNYIDKLLDDMWLNNQRVDKELAKLILQDDEKGIKLQAIKEYNSLKARITAKLQIDWNIEIEITKEQKEKEEKLLNKLKNFLVW